MEEPYSPLNRFTQAGKILFLVHLLLGIGVSVLYLCGSFPLLPPGMYPVSVLIAIFIVPVGLLCLFSFLIIAWILERFGVRVYKR